MQQDHDVNMDAKLDMFLQLSEELGIPLPSAQRDIVLNAKMKRKCKTLNISFEDARRQAFTLWLKS